MYRKLYVLLSLVLMAAFVLAACSTPTTTKAPSPAATDEPAATEPVAATEEPTATEAPAGEPVTITWWHIFTIEDQKAEMQKLADQFTAEHQNVNIEITVLENEAFKSKLTTVMQSGEPPDIATAWGGGTLVEYAKAGMLRDITPEMKAGWVDQFPAGAVDIFSHDGKYYGAPTDLGMVGIWYNKALFEQAGIATPPATWTEFLDAVKKLKDAGITPIALGAKDKWPAHYWWTYLAVRIGGKDAFNAAFSRTGKFNDPAFVEAGQRLQELVALEPFQEGYLGATYGDEATAVGTGKAAMELMGQWAPNVQKDSTADKKGIGDNLGWFPFPMVEGGKGNATDAMGGGGGWIVGKDAPDEAVEFLKFLTSPEVQEEMAGMGMVLPVTKGTDSAVTDPFNKIILENVGKAEYFQLYYDQFLPPATASVLLDNVQALLAGEATPEDVANAIEDSAAAELK